MEEVKLSLVVLSKEIITGARVSLRLLGQQEGNSYVPSGP